MTSLQKRLLSAAVGIPLLFFVVSTGGVYLSGSILLLSLIGLRELYNALINVELKPIKSIGYLATVLIFISFTYTFLPMNAVIAMLVVILLIYYVLSQTISFVDVAITLFGILYVPYLFFHIYYLENTPYIWLIFLIAFGTDTFAFIFGNLFGKTKLAPVLSPNKTREGSIGGIFGSLGLTLAYALYIDLSITFGLVIMAIIVSICSQFGDLAASKLKRWAEIKDYGVLIPGHGGVLDRFDSILFTAPLVYYYLKYFVL